MIPMIHRAPWSEFPRRVNAVITWVHFHNGKRIEDMKSPMYDRMHDSWLRRNGRMEKEGKG